MASVCPEGFLPSTIVLIPALNEAPCIAATVQRWHALGAGRVRVVDNGSTDATSSLAHAAGAEVVSEPCRGYGAAAWCGLQNWPSDSDWVLFSSADGSDRLTPDDLPAWQGAVDAGADLVLGERTSLAAGCRHLKAVQRFGNWLTCGVIAAGWGRRFRDMASLRLVRHSALLAAQMQDRAFGWNVEMQVKAIKLGWRITELPVVYHPREAGQSKISGSLQGTMRAGFGILRTLTMVWRLHRSRRALPGAIVPTPRSSA